MAQVTTRKQEYWRPPNPSAVRLIESSSADILCSNCGSECSPAARFCHVCGQPRDPGAQPAVPTHDPAGRRETRFRLPLASLLCLLLGVACSIGAALMGVIYRSDTLADWQAVQTWRVEWLLAALVALLAGLLLRKSS